ncbi:MAG: SRPBCC family protein [Chloroherpetonaceae bacterium]|nr:SRPBCC family protein [Chloroherpetonaceae bacterium]
MTTELNPSLTSTNSFSVGADYTADYLVPVERIRLMNFLSNPETFERYMPNVEAVRYEGKSDKGAALYQWIYLIPMPFASPLRLEIPTVYEKADFALYHRARRIDLPNFMQCELKFNLGKDENETLVSMHLEIQLHRSSGFDIHPLAYVMGERFISSQMRNQMEEIATTFLQKSVEAIYLASSESSPS